jgi:uncharacterized protein
VTAPVFADASAGVKRYVDEPGAALVRSIDSLVFSALSRVELPSAIWRKEREGVLGLDEVSVVLDEFELDWHGTQNSPPAFSIVATDPALLVEAAHLTGRHQLRSGDAVQLASAVVARRQDPDLVTVACFDVRLREAAAREGFRLVPAEL